MTGATGFVGSAVVRELRAAGHGVRGLTRSDAGADFLRGLGAEPVHGTLEDTAGLRDAARRADAVIHTAFEHDFNDFGRVSALDRAAIEAFGDALAGSDRPLLVTAGMLMLAAGRPATEADRPPPAEAFPRHSEIAAEALAARGMRAGTVRLPPTVHGAGDHAFIPRLIEIARATGVSAYVGDGANRWAAVHREDAAVVYRLAIEQGATGGPYHAVAEEGVPFRAIAEAIGRELGVPVVSKSPDEAAAHFGWLTAFAATDVAASAARTRATLGWAPARATLLEDMEAAGYF
ncbi:SDR family oxidoreductase [Acidisphaera rubrifaciens]|uniref:SDR family oxidoreductase n=1 Tax=Acidisphaera rubrifaciens TaxID=50715 RepID=UPI0027D92366|nr:SDR family oxidoreductase [Acidisphaera rubrifaciens]